MSHSLLELHQHLFDTGRCRSLCRLKANLTVRGCSCLLCRLKANLAALRRTLIFRAFLLYATLTRTVLAQWRMGGCVQGPSKRVPQLIRHFFPRQFWIEPGPARQQHRQKMAKLQNIFIRSFPLCACVSPCAFFVLRVCPAARALHACVCVCFLSVCFCFPYICTPYNSTTYTERVWNHSLSSNTGHTMLVSMD